MKKHLSGNDLTRRRDDLDDRARCHAFSTAAFSNYAQGSVAKQLEFDPIDRLDQAFVQEEMGFEILYFEQDVVVHPLNPLVFIRIGRITQAVAQEI